MSSTQRGGTRRRSSLAIAAVGVAASASVAALYVGIGAADSAPRPDTDHPARQEPLPAGTKVRDWSEWEVMCMRVASRYRDPSPSFCVVPKTTARQRVQP